MANEHGLFWNSQNGDRVYDANDFSEWLKKFYTTGVFNGDLAVTASGGMTVSVSSGYVNIEGKVKFFSTPTTLTIATAGGTYERIDTVVAECNYSDREITVKVVTGAYSASPKATAPVRTAAAYQLVLAEIDVPAGATEITQKNITDMRTDSSVCGLVTGTVSQIDFSTVKAQFDSWFEDVKGTLDSDAAGNLKNQIDAANEKIAQLYPVGSIYLSVNDTNPGTFIGGTWERIKDRFLLAAGDTYAAGSTGGEAQHTLTQKEIPDYKIGAIPTVVSVGHTNWNNGGVSGTFLGQASNSKKGIWNKDDELSMTSGTQYGYSISTYGGGQPHNNMPPYIAVYMWVRTA